MTELLGLPLDTALARLAAENISDIRIERYTAPRDGNTRGTLRIVRVREGGRLLTVCLFPDSVKSAEEDGLKPAEESEK